MHREMETEIGEQQQQQQQKKKKKDLMRIPLRCRSHLQTIDLNFTYQPTDSVKLKISANTYMK